MPEDYQDLVLATYKKLRDNGSLYSILQRETTTALKKACLKVYDKRFTEKDEDILSLFFDIDKMECDFRKEILKAGADDFKALLNHISGNTKRTDERNSDLLAWLIDFQPRPSIKYYKSFDSRGRTEGEEVKDPTKETGEKNLNPPDSDKDEGENCEDGKVGLDDKDKKNDLVGNTEDFIAGGSNQNTEGENIGVGGHGDKGTKSPEEEYIPRFSPRQITIFCIILLFFGSTSFVAWENRTINPRMPDAGEQCMYWEDDHYEPINCEAQIPGKAIIPLNHQILKQQRKINIPDTLTEYSIGKIWYKGYGGNNEYFTAGGIYPADTLRILKPLSAHILKKYSSYYRYMLTRMVWFLFAAVLLSLCGFWISTLKKVVQQPIAEPGTNQEEEAQFNQQAFEG